MAKNWWDFAITQSYNPPTEYGVDVATPQDTPLSALLGGRVSKIGYFPWGGEIDIATSLPGSSKHYTEYFLHLDQINPALQVGQIVRPGDFLGLSGGQTHGGAHPTGAAYSSGPHTEFGLFEGGAFSGKSIDPTGLLQAADAHPPSSSSAPPSDNGNLVNFTGPGGISFTVGNPYAGLGAGLTNLGNSVSGIPQATVGALSDAFNTTEQSIAEWLKRQSVAFFVAAVVLMVLFL